MWTFARVLLDGPLAGRYIYRCAADAAPTPGDWVLVPWGRSRRVGLVRELTPRLDLAADGGLEPARIRDIEGVLPGLPRMSPGWLAFIDFAAGYYHGEPAELALGSVPKLLRVPPSARTRTSADRRLAAFDPSPPASPHTLAGPEASRPVTLNDAQATALAALLQPPAADPKPWLLYGITGSGKTEVYLGWIEALLARDPAHQVLLLVPEIGLTPALLEQLRRRFPGGPIAVLHSEMPDAARASHWLAAASGTARIVLGTRLAVLAQLPGLAGIVIDEEHDPSYKQQEGIRYSARDLGVARAAQAGVPVLLGSATPSLETWHNARIGRYRKLVLRDRVRGAALPAVRIIGLRGTAKHHGLAEASIAAIRDTLARGEQALVFLNRRGYAPVLSCDACGWLSRCDHCDAFRVLHRTGAAGSGAVAGAVAGTGAVSARVKGTVAGAPASTRPAGPARYRLICHHCATERPVPRTCPDCGNQDLTALGRGTQRLEEGLAELFPTARIGRLDRDVAKRRGATERFLAAAHAGETDLLVGTQMLAKGHDFTRLTLVVAVDADAGLFAADFRAPERLFATLMQVAGRAGRHLPSQATTLIQSRYPEHPLFAALVAHDYPGFAAAQLAEREAGHLPPFAYQTLLLAQARTMDATVGFLESARECLLSLEPPEGVTVCDPVPMPLAQLKNLARAQLLVESKARRPLHALLSRWQPRLDPIAAAIRGTVRWQLVIDPVEI